MAKEKTTNDPPAFIDYEGAQAASESANAGNAFADCKRYWRQELFNRHRVGGLVWGIKEQSLLSRLLQEFEVDDVIKQMMNQWINEKELKYAINFSLFYKNRYVLRERVGPKDYDW